MRLKTLHNSDGFSLIEMMTVMAIIGMLAAMAMISFQDTLRHARDNSARADARNMIVVINEHYANFESPVDLETGYGAGIWVTGPIGNPRIYTLGLHVQAELKCENKTSSWDPGTFEASFRAINGTPNVTFDVWIDEATGLAIISFWGS